MKFLNIKIIDGARGEYYGSIIQHPDGTFYGVGEDSVCNTLLNFKGKITDETLQIKIFLGESNVYFRSVDCIKRDSDAEEVPFECRKYYEYRELPNDYKSWFQIEITNVKEFSRDLRLNNKKR